MKKFDFKSVVLGFVIAFIGLTVAHTVNAANFIREASFSQVKLYWLGQEVPLENPLISIVADGDTEAILYMPVREFLEFMNFVVEYDVQNDRVNLSMIGMAGDSQTQPYAWNGIGVYSGGYSEHPSTLSQAEVDRRAADIMQRTGNWSYVEPYLPYMSNQGITRMVNIFNSKRPNPRQHRNAQDYFN